MKHAIAINIPFISQ